MTCPKSLFVCIPHFEQIASSRSAFAESGINLVNLLHAQVISLCRITDWSQAATEEGAHLMALVDKFETQVEARHMVGALNRGFSDGTAADQTFAHLNPRFVYRLAGDAARPKIDCGSMRTRR